MQHRAPPVETPGVLEFFLPVTGAFDILALQYIEL